MDPRPRGLLSTFGGSGEDTPLPPLPRRVLLAIAGLGCGVSPAFFGYFDLSLWGPIGVGLVVAASALLIARRSVPRGLSAVAVLGLFAFATWCLLSMGWAESADRALTEGDRWIVSALYLLVLMLLIVNRRDIEVLFVATAIGILGVASYDLVQMLGPDSRDLFIGSRLLEPLGYVNGLGGFFLLGFWPLLALAERVRQPLLTGAAAGGATLLAALVLLTDSRGTAIAFIASAVALLVLLPGRNRRAWAILAVLAGLLAAWGPLTDVTRELPGGVPAQPVETIRRGAEWALLAGAGVAVCWGLGNWALDSVTARAPAAGRLLPRVSAVLITAIALVGFTAIAVAVDDPAGRISAQYRAFTELEPVKGARFTSGGGNRYDYWRIAWSQFTEHPLDGVGAGNFDRTYFIERRTNEDVRQAHSIELQALGDTGLVGAALLGSFLVAVLAGASRCAGAVRRRETEAGIVIAAVGTFTVWLVQTSVDWLHLIPGVTGIALGAAAALLRCPLPDVQPGSDPAPKPDLLRVPPATLVAILPLAITAIVFIGRPTMAEHLRSVAKENLTVDPRLALKAAEESRSLNPGSLQAYYLEAASLARLGAFHPALESIREAIRREPHNYVSWALLGDLLTRRGAISAAMRAYRRAWLLNPRERELKMLATQRPLVERLSEHPGSA